LRGIRAEESHTMKAPTWLLLTLALSIVPTLVILGIVYLHHPDKPKRFKNAKAWEQHERDGGGS
jgi:hypothetical protein